MPRTARIDIPGIVHHVMVRGIEKRTIFLDDDDRVFFLQRLSSLLQTTETDCLAWALMSNHCHLLVRPCTNSLATFMRRLLTGHAVYFNRRHQRVGHLFQNRYKSIVCQENSYLLQVIRYIHLNPLRSGIVADMDHLDAYPWTGHAVLMGRQSLPGQQVDDVLLLFGSQLVDARRRYRDFVAAEINEHDQQPVQPVSDKPDSWAALCKSLKSNGGGDDHGDFSHDDRILGSTSFAENLLRQLGEGDLPAQPPLADIKAMVAEYYALPAASLGQNIRTAQVSNARSVFCFLATQKYRYRAAEVARALGVTRAAVSVAIRRGEKILQDQKTDLGTLLNC